MSATTSAPAPYDVLVAQLPRCVDRALEAAAAIVPFEDLAPDARRALRALIDRCCREFVDRVTAPGADASADVGHLVDGLFQVSDVSLEEALQLLRVGASAAWVELARAAGHRLGAAELERLETAAQRFHNDLSAALSTSYLKANRARRRASSHTRADLLRALISRPQQMSAARATAHALGMVLDGPWQVAVFAPAPGVPGALPRLQSDVRMQPAHRCIADVVDDRVVVACAPVTGDLGWVTSPDAAACGIGGVRAAVSGVADSYDEALEALRLARIKSVPLLRCDDARLDRFLVGSLSADDLADAMLAPLRSLTPHRQALLLETLEAYLDCEGSVGATAETLHLHRQSVNYRVAQLRKTFGAALSTADGRLALHVAVRAARLRTPAV